MAPSIKKVFKRLKCRVPTGNLLVRRNYWLVYNVKLARPTYVLEVITAASFEKSLSKTEENQFRTVPGSPDPALPDCQPTRADIINLGMENGHLAAARNFGNSKLALEEASLMGNTSPMSRRFNRGAWNSIELSVAKYSATVPWAAVITVPVYGSSAAVAPKSGREVHVPIKYCKIVVAEKLGKLHAAQVFVVPAHPCDFFDVMCFSSTLEEVKVLTGLDWTFLKNNLVQRQRQLVLWRLPFCGSPFHTCVDECKSRRGQFRRSDMNVRKRLRRDQADPISLYNPTANATAIFQLDNAG